MKVEEMNGIKVGDTVTLLIGPHKGKQCTVLEIRKNEGAINGWFTIKLPSGNNGLAAGEEIRK